MQRNGQQCYAKLDFWRNYEAVEAGTDLTAFVAKEVEELPDV